MTNSRSVFSYDFFKHPLFLCLLSASFLVLSFPQFDIWIFAWVALIPLMAALDGKKILASFFLSYFTGVLFFAGTLFWFIHVTLLGMILLILYFAVYFGLFGLGYYFFSKQAVLSKIFVLPSLWVILELARSRLLSGFGWVSMGHSQYKNLPLIQVADIAGMFVISFVVVMANVLFKEVMTKKLSRAYIKKEILIPAVLVIFVLTSFLVYGSYRLNQPRTPAQFNIAVIQANIAQEMKWNEEFWPAILKKHLDLTQEAAQQKPDLIIWPETAFPGFVWESPELFSSLREVVAKNKIPLLLGLVIQNDGAYYNSAILINKDGKIIKQHDKLHLVPFGEYVPLRDVFPFLADLAPIGDFTPGMEYTLFPAMVEAKPKDRSIGDFSVLICFEDTVPEISAKFTQAKTNLLINMTNDAWFKDTKAPFLHLQAAVFRTIENRKNLVRAANTGVSCFIDEFGKITNYVQNKNGKKTYVAGYATGDVALNTTQTFYTKHPDLFTYFCFGGILMGIALKKLKISAWTKS
ncbi:MAG: apolipoprotein N-acyltransferase [Candidatus Omnitrophota bacterium]